MVNRPLSPHIQIYRPQITSILSILHRFTGIGLVFGVLLFCVGFVSFSISEAAWNEFITIWHSVGGKFWQWPLIFSLHYHSINGIRHLMWDIGYGFEIKAVTQTGIITIFLSFVTTLLFAYFCLIFQIVENSLCAHQNIGYINVSQHSYFSFLSQGFGGQLKQ